MAVGLGAALGLAVLDLTIWSAAPGSQLLWLVAGLLGGSPAVALDDPAATCTSAVPTGHWSRTAIRLLVALGALAAWSGYVARVADSASVPGEPVSWLALVLSAPPWCSRPRARRRRSAECGPENRVGRGVDRDGLRARSDDHAPAPGASRRTTSRRAGPPPRRCGWASERPGRWCSSGEWPTRGGAGSVSDGTPRTTGAQERLRWRPCIR